MPTQRLCYHHGLTSRSAHNCTQVPAPGSGAPGRRDDVAEVDLTPEDTPDPEQTDGATGLSDEEDAESLLGGSGSDVSNAEVQEEHEEAGEAPTTDAAAVVKHRCVAWLCVSRGLAHEHPHRMTRLELSSVDIALVRWNCS